MQVLVREGEIVALWFVGVLAQLGCHSNNLSFVIAIALYSFAVRGLSEGD